VKDILNVDGKTKEGVYQQINTKMYYFRVINMVHKAVNCYKNVMANITNIIPNIEQIPISVKSVYQSLVKKKAILPQSSRRWSTEFAEEIDWSKTAQNKIQKQLEVKVAEMNYKILNNILATNSNLFKWRKSPTHSCIYCNHDTHDSKHLLWDCPGTQIVWNTVEYIFQIDISWKVIVLGVDGHLLLNQIVSLLAYIIYKKNQQEKEVINQHQDMKRYVREEIYRRLTIYQECKDKEGVISVLCDIMKLL
jgi:hypothetical protein